MAGAPTRHYASGAPHGSRGRLEGTVDWLLFPQAFEEPYFREAGTNSAGLLLAERLPPSLPGSFSHFVLGGNKSFGSVPGSSHAALTLVTCSHPRAELRVSPVHLLWGFTPQCGGHHQPVGQGYDARGRFPSSDPLKSQQRHQHTADGRRPWVSPKA